MTASTRAQSDNNKAIHYNEWADLSKNDFKPVVTEFNNFFSCSGATSQSAIPGCL
jgi:hypothetical protein